jgi:hypothetical protein
VILVLGVVLAAALVPVTGGRLTRLADIRIRHVWLIGAALGIQILVISVIPDVGPEWAHRTAHVGSYVLGIAFVVVNLHVPGLWIAALGGGANFLAIGANGGVMPASARALEIAGKTPTPDGFANSVLVEDARLWFLGDIFAIPDGWPLANVFSIGDVLLVIGCGIVVHAACGSRLVPRRWRATDEGHADTAPHVRT